MAGGRLGLLNGGRLVSVDENGKSGEVGRREERKYGAVSLLLLFV